MASTEFFQNKIVWITGASSGIGEALAVMLAQQGATLVLSARREGELERVRAACQNPDAHLVLPLDLADFDAHVATQRVLEHFDRVDVLINSGGVSQRSTVAETALDVDRRIMEINYFGTIKLTKAVLPSMLARGSGHIVAVSSVVGHFATARRSAYAASKHALHGFFDALRAEVHAAGVRVTLVSPGYVRTNISLNALTGDGSKHAQMDSGQEKGLSAEACAAQILRAVEQERGEVVIGRERFAVYAHRLVPGLFNRVLRSVRRT